MARKNLSQKNQELTDENQSLQKRLNEAEKRNRMFQNQLQTAQENYDLMKAERDEYIEKFHNLLKEVGEKTTKRRAKGNKLKSKYDELFNVHIAVVKKLS